MQFDRFGGPGELHVVEVGLIHGTIRSTVGRELPLAGAAEAHRLPEAREVQGVVLLRPEATGSAA